MDQNWVSEFDYIIVTMATLEEHETAMAEVAEAIEKHEQDKSNYEETVKKYQEGIAFLLSFQEQQARIHPNAKLTDPIRELARLRRQLDDGVPIQRCIDTSDSGTERAIQKLQRLLQNIQRSVADLERGIFKMKEEYCVLAEINKRLVELEGPGR